MSAEIISIKDTLAEIPPKKFQKVMETESLYVACQQFDGDHLFKHLNDAHDEILYIISGELKVWTEDREFQLTAGNLFKIPKGLKHGDLKGDNVKILIIEGKL